jgi:hypothetical protein
MSDLDAYRDEMRRLGRLDDRDIDRLLTGEPPPQDEGLEELATFLRAARTRFHGAPGVEVQDRHLREMLEASRGRAVDAPVTAGVRPRRAPGLPHLRPGIRIAVAMLALLAGTAGLATAGVDLPEPAEDVLGGLGVDVPPDRDGQRGPHTRGSGPGEHGDGAQSEGAGGEGLGHEPVTGRGPAAGAPGTDERGSRGPRRGAERGAQGFARSRRGAERGAEQGAQGFRRGREGADRGAERGARGFARGREGAERGAEQGAQGLERGQDGAERGAEGMARGEAGAELGAQQGAQGIERGQEGAEQGRTGAQRAPAGPPQGTTLPDGGSGFERPSPDGGPPPSGTPPSGTPGDGPFAGGEAP